MSGKKLKKMEHQVFISYVSEKSDPTGSDHRIADKICSAIESKGIRCWIVHRDIAPGQNWPDEISKAIPQARIMVLVLSANSEKSRFIKMEVTQAVNKDVTIIPFCIEDVSLREGLELLLGDCQWIIAHPETKDEHFDRLVNDVCAQLGKKRKEISEEEGDVQVALQKQEGSKEELKEMPADVKDVKQKANKVYKNQKGYWEAEFNYGIIMVYIPVGEFTMGSNDESYNERPAHKVYLDGYWIGKYEVTFEQYDKYCGETGKKKPRDKGWDRGKRPVINVSWYEATAYCKLLSIKTGFSFSLPTEAQWEKAARGTEGLIYPWGDEFDKHKCNSFEAGLKKTSPVGKFPEGISPYGCFDMAGNVWEWCLDWYGYRYYKKSFDKNPKGPSFSLFRFRVFRGGGWGFTALFCRASSRFCLPPGNRWNALGFRLAGSL